MTAGDMSDLFTRRTALAGLGAGALALALAPRGLGAWAQEATPIAREDHPIIGVWQGNPDPGNPNKGLSIRAFDMGGAYVEFGIGWADGVSPAVGIGAWRPTGERTVEVFEIDASIVSLDLFFQIDKPLPANLLEGPTLLIRHVAGVDETGNRIAGTMHWLDDQGNEIPSTYTAEGSVRMLAVPTT